MGKVADGWSFRLCCLRCLWAWRWCSASSCLLLGTTRLCGLAPACTVPRCLSSGEEEKEGGLVARGPGTHGHILDLAPPTVRMPQGTSSMPACWRRCWKRQDWRTPTCRTVPTGEAPGLDLASLWPQFPYLGSGQWSSRVPAAPHPCLGPGSLHISASLGVGYPQHCPALSPSVGAHSPAPPPRAPECTQPTVCWFSVPELPADVAKILASGNWTLESPSPACQCSQPGARLLLPDCPAAAGGPPPPQALTSSGEVVQNLTGRNLSDFLVKTYPRLVHQG